MGSLIAKLWCLRALARYRIRVVAWCQYFIFNLVVYYRMDWGWGWVELLGPVRKLLPESIMR